MEFKESPGKPFYRTISAFANTDGGTILIGVADDRDIRGYDCSNDNVKVIADTIVNKIQLHPLIETISVEGKNVLKVVVSKSAVPIAYEGKYYKRVGNTTREMQSEELQNFFLHSSRWDSLTGDFTADEIDADAIHRFINTAVASGRVPVPDEGEKLADILKHLNLMQGGKITNAAIILFGKNPQQYFQNAVVRVGRLKQEDIIVSDREISGNLFNQLRGVEEAIRELINVRYEIPEDSLKRREVWDYPIPALREALLNALVHRDYFQSHRQIQIKIFDSSIWFHSPGELPEGLIVEDLLKAHPSVPRNPLLAQVMYKAGFIETYGSGIRRMVNALSDASQQFPVFCEEFGGFSVTMEKRLDLQTIIAGKNLSDRQVQAVMYVLENGMIVNKEYQQISAVSRQTATRDLKELTEKDILVPFGKGRNLGYRLA